MPWNGNIPQPGDLPSQSQNLILQNFQQLTGYIYPAQPTINLTQVAAPVPAVPVANGWQLFTMNGTSGVGELTLQDDAGNQYPITQIGLTIPPYGVVANRPQKNGWCYLPCGMLMFWASQTSAGAVNIALTAATAANFPGFTTVYTAWTGMFGNAGGPNAISYISGLTTNLVTIQMNTDAGHITHVTVFVIGE